MSPNNFIIIIFIQLIIINMPVMPRVKIFYVTSNGRLKTILRYYPIFQFSTIAQMINSWGAPYLMKPSSHVFGKHEVILAIASPAGLPLNMRH